MNNLFPYLSSGVTGLYSVFTQNMVFLGVALALMAGTLLINWLYGRAKRGGDGV